MPTKKNSEKFIDKMKAKDSSTTISQDSLVDTVKLLLELIDELEDRIAALEKK